MDFLRKIPFFEEISDEDLQLIADIMIERTYKKNRILFMEGEPSEAIFFVKSGKVKIYKTSEDGREHILDIASPGDIFAEVVLFNKVPYPATAELIEDGEIAFIRNKDLEDLLRRKPDFAIAIITILNKRLIEAQAQIKSLALRDTYSRTAWTLLKLAEEHGRKKPEGIELDLNISRQELASMVGTTRETVTRILTSFKKYKILELDRQSIIIKDPEGLKSWI